MAVDQPPGGRPPGGRQTPQIPTYTQIPLNVQNLFPYRDLGAGGGYDRSLILPDDIIPVLALPYFMNGQGNRAAQCDPDGSLWVSIKSGGGGGGVAAAKYGGGFWSQWFGTSTPGAEGMFGTGLLTQYVFGVSASMVIRKPIAGAGAMTLSVWLGQFDDQFNSILLLREVLATDGSLTSQNNMARVFSPAIDVVASLGTSDVMGWFTVGSDNPALVSNSFFQIDGV